MNGSVSSPDPLERPVANATGSRPAASESVAGGGGWGRTLGLAAGDLVSFLVFAAVGRHTHGYSDSLSVVGDVLYTAFPFAAGWFIVAPFLRAFSRPRTTGVKNMLRQTEIAWLCAWPVTLLLRWIFSSDHQIPLSFAIVVLLANAVFLGVWRGVFAVVDSRVSAGKARQLS